LQTLDACQWNRISLSLFVYHFMGDFDDIDNLLSVARRKQTLEPTVDRLMPAFDTFRSRPLSDTTSLRAAIVLNLLLRWVLSATKMNTLCAQESFQACMCARTPENTTEDLVCLIDECIAFLVWEAERWMKCTPNDESVEVLGTSLQAFGFTLSEVVGNLAYLFRGDVASGRGEITFSQTSRLMDELRQVLDAVPQ
jgi:hypothetical protein